MFSLWSVVKSPLMLGHSLDDVRVGDEVHNIIANKHLIDVNQDALGIQVPGP